MEKDIKNETNEKQETKVDKKISDKRLFITIITMLVLIAFLSSIIFITNHRDKENTQMTNNSDLQTVCNTITDEMLVKSINEFKNFGELGVKDGFVVGLKEITVKNSGEVFYSNCDGSMLFVGAVIDKTGRNHTKEAMDKAVKELFEAKTKKIDKSIAIKMGQGKHELIVFTDPDCPYCRAAEAMFSVKPLDATRYVYFTPLDSIHPEAAKKAVHVLCSANPAEELIKVIKNEITEFPNQCEEGRKKLEQHRKLASELGVTGTPTFYLDGQRFVGANPKMYEITGQLPDNKKGKNIKE